MTQLVEVSAGVLLREDGCFLLGQRAEGSFYPGYWEFPGGKVEPGETPAQALIRELDEELGIQAGAINPWLVRVHLYEHARVRLHFFEVTAWCGELDDRVHAALSWERADALTVGPMLPANGPILKALRLPRRMCVIDPRGGGENVPGGWFDRVLADDVTIVRIGEEDFSQRLELGSTRFAARAHAAGALLMVNMAADAALPEWADGGHLAGADLMSIGARPDWRWVGASCRDRAELERAAQLGLDYAVLEEAIPSASVGFDGEAFRALTALLPMPVFAMDDTKPESMLRARSAGAHGIAFCQRDCGPESDASFPPSGSDGVVAGIR